MLSAINIVITLLFINLAENVSNNVSLSDNSGLDESETLIEIVDSMPCIPIELDIDLDVTNLEVVLMPDENDENSSTLITKTHKHFNDL